MTTFCRISIMKKNDFQFIGRVVESWQQQQRQRKSEIEVLKMGFQGLCKYFPSLGHVCTIREHLNSSYHLLLIEIWPGHVRSLKVCMSSHFLSIKTLQPSLNTLEAGICLIIPTKWFLRTVHYLQDQDLSKRHFGY